MGLHIPASYEVCVVVGVLHGEFCKFRRRDLAPSTSVLLPFPEAANLAWSCAKIGFAGEHFLSAIGNQATAIVSELVFFGCKGVLFRILFAGFRSRSALLIRTGGAPVVRIFR